MLLGKQEFQETWLVFQDNYLLAELAVRAKAQLKIRCRADEAGQGRASPEAELSQPGAVICY